MTNYTMPVLSEKERAEQVEWLANEVYALERYITRLESDGETFNVNPHKRELIRAKIALAALTAKTIGYTYCGRDLYTAPPVPVKQEGEQ